MKNINRAITIVLIMTIINTIVATIITKNGAYIASVIWIINFFILHRVNIIQDKHNDYLFKKLMNSYKDKLITIKFISKICNIIDEDTVFIAKQDLINAINEYKSDCEENKRDE